MSRTLPEDYAIDALALEANRRAKALGHRYSYGQLIADTTLQERMEIVEAHRTEKSRAELRKRKKR